MDKVQEILLNNNIDISNTRFWCLDGTNAMPGEPTGLFTKENPQFSSIVNLCQLQMSPIGFMFQAFVWSVSLA